MAVMPYEMEKDTKEIQFFNGNSAIIAVIFSTRFALFIPPSALWLVV